MASLFPSNFFASFADWLLFSLSFGSSLGGSGSGFGVTDWAFDSIFCFDFSACWTLDDSAFSFWIPSLIVSPTTIPLKIAPAIAAPFSIIEPTAGNNGSMIAALPSGSI